MADPKPNVGIWIEPPDEVEYKGTLKIGVVSTYEPGIVQVGIESEDGRINEVFSATSETGKLENVWSYNVSDGDISPGTYRIRGFAFLKTKFEGEWRFYSDYETIKVKEPERHKLDLTLKDHEGNLVDQGKITINMTDSLGGEKIWYRGAVIMKQGIGITYLEEGTYVLESSYSGEVEILDTSHIEMPDSDYEYIVELPAPVEKGTLEMRIRDSESEDEVADAYVSIYAGSIKAENLLITKKTSSAGIVSFELEKDKTYVYMIKHTEYQTKSNSFEFEEDISKDVSIIKAEVPRPHTLHFEVRDDDTNDLLSLVTISLEGEEKKTDTFGEAKFDEVMPGNYTVILSKSGYETKEDEIHMPNRSKTYRFHLKSTDEPPEPEPEKLFYFVQVEDGSGNILSGVEVNVGSNNKYTTDFGTIHFWIDSGKEYIVYIDHPGYEYFEKSIKLTEDSTDVLELTPLEIEPEPETEWIKIGFHVTDKSTGENIGDQYVYVTPEGAPGPYDVMTDMDGNAFFDVDVGIVHAVEVSREGYHTYTSSITPETPVMIEVELVPSTEPEPEPPEPWPETDEPAITSDNLDEISDTLDPGSPETVYVKFKNNWSTQHTFALGLSLVGPDDSSYDFNWLKKTVPANFEFIEPFPLNFIVPADAGVGEWEIIIRLWKSFSGGAPVGMTEYNTGGQLFGENPGDGIYLDEVRKTFNVSDEDEVPVVGDVPNVEDPYYMSIVPNELIDWFIELALNLLGWLYAGFIEFLRQGSFGWIGLFYWIFTGNRMNWDDMESFLRNHGDFFSAGNLILVPVRGINTKGETQTELTFNDFVAGGLTLWPVVANPGVVARFGTTLSSYFGSTASTFARYGTGFLSGSLRGGGALSKSKALGIMNIIRNSPSWIVKSVAALIPTLTELRTASTMTKAIYALWIWNFLFDWVWMQSFGIELIRYITGDDLNRYKNLYYRNNDDMVRIYWASEYAETEEDWASVKEDLEALRPTIDEFKVILDENDLFTRIGDTYPEGEQAWNKWMAIYERLIVEASEKSGGLVVPSSEVLEGEVVSVIDGDTVKLRYVEGEETHEESIRLVGIDSPEKAYCNTQYGEQRCYEEEYGARDSTEWLKSQIGGKTVKVSIDPENPLTVRGTRLLGLIELGEVNINLESLRAGWSKYYPYSANKYVDDAEFRSAEQEAKDAMRGIWAMGFGSVGVASTPSRADIYINGVFKEVQTSETLELPPGETVIGVKLDGYVDAEQTVTVVRDEKKEIHFKLDVVGDTAEIYIASVPANVPILLNGEDTGLLTPETVELTEEDFDGESEGSVELSLQKEGYREWSSEVFAKLGEKKRFEIILEEELAKTGKVHITSEPSGASIIPKGVPIVEKLTPETLEFEAFSEIEIELQLEGYEPYIFENVWIPRDETTEIHAELKEVQTTGKVKLVSSPTYASIIVDDEDYGLTQKVIELDPGTYNIVLRKSGYHDFVFNNVNVVKGHQKELFGELLKVDEEATVGKVSVLSSPNYASIHLEDKNGVRKNYGYTPQTIEKIKPGGYTLYLSRKGYVPVSQKISVEAGASSEVFIEMESKVEVASLYIGSNPTGASISIDGEPTYLNTPETLEFDEDELGGSSKSFEISLEKESYETFRQIVTLSIGDEKRVEAILEKTEEVGLSITSSPSNASIFVGGENIGKRTPETIQLSPGDYQIILKLEGYEDYSFGTVAVETGVKELHANMVKTEVADTGVRLLSSPTNAKIYINGEDTKYVTPKTVKLEPGTYGVKLELTGFVEKSFNVAIESGKISDAYAKLDPIEEEIGYVKVRSSPTGGTIKVDNIDVSKVTTSTFRLEPGVHAISVSKTGYETITKSVTIEKGKTSEMIFELESIEVPEDRGVLSLKSKPSNAEITLNGAGTGKLSPEEFELDPGTYEIVLSKSGYESWSGSVEITAGETSEIYGVLLEIAGEEEEREEEKAEEAAVTYAVPEGWPWTLAGGSSGEGTEEFGTTTEEL